MSKSKKYSKISEFNVAVSSAKSEEIALLLTFSGAGRKKINLLLEEYLMEDGDVSDYLVKANNELYNMPSKPFLTCYWYLAGMSQLINKF